jgi:hypothetical protein
VWNLEGPVTDLLDLSNADYVYMYVYIYIYISIVSASDRTSEITDVMWALWMLYTPFL